MSDSALVSALVANWSSIVTLIGPPAAAELRRLFREWARAMSGSGLSADPVAASVALTEFVLNRLPPGHPVRLAAINDDTYLGPSPVAPVAEGLNDDLKALLAEIEREVIADSAETRDRIHARLRRLRAHGAAEVRVFGHRPPYPGVIVLTSALGEALFPAFQFDDRGAVLPVVRSVNEMLGADGDPWGVADWWVSVNGWLGCPPVALLGAGRDDDLIAVAATVGEVV